MMSYNILESAEGRIDPVAEVVRLARADVVVVQECWDRELFHKLADRLGMDRFQAECVGNPMGAVGVMCRGKIREAVNHGGLAGRKTTRAVVTAVVEIPGEPGQWETLAVVGVHLYPGERLADEEVRLGELPGVLEIAKGFAGFGHVVAGDFNSYHPEQKIDVALARPSAQKRVAEQGNEFPRAVVRRMLECGYVDAHALHHAAEEFGCSFTTAYPAARVDYIFVTADLCPRVRSCEVFRPEIGKFASDHFPVVAEIAANTT